MQRYVTAQVLSLKMNDDLDRCPQTMSLEQLPDSVLLQIISYTSVCDTVSLSQTCTRVRQLTLDSPAGKCCCQPQQSLSVVSPRAPSLSTHSQCLCVAVCRVSVRWKCTSLSPAHTPCRAGSSWPKAACCVSGHVERCTEAGSLAAAGKSRKPFKWPSAGSTSLCTHTATAAGPADPGCSCSIHLWSAGLRHPQLCRHARL